MDRMVFNIDRVSIYNIGYFVIKVECIKFLLFELISV